MWHHYGDGNLDDLAPVWASTGAVEEDDDVTGFDEGGVFAFGGAEAETGESGEVGLGIVEATVEIGTEDHDGEEMACGHGVDAVVLDRAFLPASVIHSRPSMLHTRHGEANGNDGAVRACECAAWKGLGGH